MELPRKRFGVIRRCCAIRRGRKIKKLLLTGGTGYIGSMLIKHILQNQNDKNKIKIIAPVRNLDKARRMLPDEAECYETDSLDKAFMDKDVSAGAFADIAYDYIIHCACATDSGEMVTHPVETTAGILKITENILEIAKRCKESGKLKSMVYLSSMEVYGRMDCPDGHKVSEKEAGYIDLLNVRSCYPLGKRMAENLCYSYFKEYGLPIKIARLAQTFGRGIPACDQRVFAQFARAAARGNDIILHTKGNSMGNYCGIDDAVKGILLILEKGEAGEAYNVVNEANTMTIREMARLAADQSAGGKSRVRCDIPKDDQYGYAADTGLRLSGKKLTELGWTPKQSLREMYLEVINDITDLVKSAEKCYS